MLTRQSFFADMVQPSKYDIISRRICRTGLSRVAALALLDEVGVLDGARGVAPHPDAVLLQELARRAEVLHRDRLSAGHVHRDADVDVGDVLRAGALR